MGPKGRFAISVADGICIIIALYFGESGLCFPLRSRCAMLCFFWFFCFLGDARDLLPSIFRICTECGCILGIFVQIRCILDFYRVEMFADFTETDSVRFHVCGAWECAV